jgi:hypothetical protein
MAPTVPTASPSCGIPPSLYPLYETYKRGTTTIVEYLHSNGKTKIDNLAPPRISVRGILELAKEVVAKAIKPPKYIHDAFNVVLVNRRKIANHYERTQQDSQKATVESTKRHKFFNETLAYAYDVLFPSLPPPSRKVAKKAKAAARISGASWSSSDSDCASTNRFEVLSDMLEQESAFEGFVFNNTKSKYQSPVKLSVIEDDPLEAAIALHLYLTEVEDVISVCKSSWESCVQGSFALPLAGWTTMFGQEIIRHVADLQDTKFDGYQGMMHEYLAGKAGSIWGKGLAETALQFPLCPAGLPYDFRELTQGSGIVWPVEALRGFWKGEHMLDACDMYISGCTKERTLVEYFGTKEGKEIEEMFTQRVLACFIPVNGVPASEDTALTGLDVLRLEH